MNQQVVINLQPVRSYIRGTLSTEIFKKISMKLSFRVQKAEFSPKFQDGRWDGRIRLFDMNDLSYPTGLTAKLVGLFNELGVGYQIYDQRPVSQPIANWQWVSKEIKELRDYQLAAVKNAIQNKIGIIQVGTGGGKTVIMAKFVQELSRRTLVLVHKIDLLEQARDKLKECLGIEVGYIGNQRAEIKDVNVGTVQTIVKCLGFRYHKFMDDEKDEKLELKEQKKEQVRHLLRTVHVVIIDESHHVRSETQQNIMNNVPIADYRIGLSATPMRDQGDDLLIEGIFGDILCKISASYLISRGFLIPPIIKFNKIEHTVFDFFEFVKVDDDGNITYCNPPQSTGKQGGRRRTIDVRWEELANRNIEKLEEIDEDDIMYEYMDGSRLVRKWNRYEGPTNFVHHLHVKLEEICTAIFDDVLAEEVRRKDLKFKKDEYKKWYRKMRRKYRDLVMKSKYAFIYDACITDNEYRNFMIAQYVNMHRIQGHSTLVLVSRLRHGENIKKAFSSLNEDMIFLKGEDDIEVRVKVVDEVKQKKRDILIASTIADEGLDLPALDTVVMSGGGTSKTTALQRVGRALRLFPGKTKAYIEEFSDDAQYLSKHSKDREYIYRTEPAFEVISGTG